MKENNQSHQKKHADDSAQDLSDQYEVRLGKLEKLIEDGKSPYDLSFSRGNTAIEALETDESEFEGKTFRLAGRIRSRRIMGKASFMDLEDETGRIQMYGSQKDLGDDYDLFKHLDLGDIVGVEGSLFITKTGQKTINLSSVILLSKCLRPLPVVKEAEGKVFDAFADKEQRYRMRYVDLIVNPDVKKNFILRSRLIQEIRKYLSDRDFLEVETPMMQPIPGGASAKPFITHHNALDMELYLRIAPELYLKRLIVGGFPRVFELNRNFRNEGISLKHNPEFTMLEIYEAYSDMEGMLDLFEDMITHIATELLGTLKIPYGDQMIDLSRPWRRLKYLDAIKEIGGVDLREDMSVEEAKKAAREAGIDDEGMAFADNVWAVAEYVFDEKVEPNLIQPIFITHFPVVLSPLAKTWPENKNYVERFEPYIAGREMGNAFSELNDPIDQKHRFEDQVKRREAGDEEAGYMDLDYVRALEYGLPPTGGLGVGIDRLAMLITNSHSIRDTILFPLMRPEKEL